MENRRPSTPLVLAAFGDPHSIKFQTNWKSGVCKEASLKTAKTKVREGKREGDVDSTAL